MTARTHSSSATLRTQQQRGYALIGIIAAVGIAATTVLVTSLSTTALRNEQERRTGYALAQAKQALIGRAAADDNHPGSLPCPDLDNNGVAAPTCAQAGQQIGRLPWQTLGLPDLRDASGERLWYAVSANFVDVPGNAINSNTVGQLSISGTLPVSNAVAVVFAPGAPFGSQQRDATRENSVTSYLEAYSPATPSTFVSMAAGGAFNDRMMPVMPTDVFAVVQKRVAKEMIDALNAYFAVNGVYPYAALASNGDCRAMSLNPDGCRSQAGVTVGMIPSSPVPASPAYSGTATLLGSSDWFEANKWREVIQYGVAPACATLPVCATGTISINAGGTGGDVAANPPALSNQKLVLLFSGVPGDTTLRTALVQSIP